MPREAPYSMKQCPLSGVAQTAAFSGLRLYVSGPQLPRTDQKTVGPRYTVFFQKRARQ